MPTYHTLIVAHTMQPSDSSRNVERASKTVSCSYAFEEGVLQIQIALSKAGGGLLRGWEYKLSGSNPHNGITRHNTNKARVQASTILTQRHAESALSISLSFSVAISSPPCSFFHLHTQTDIATYRQSRPHICQYFLFFIIFFENLKQF